MKAWILEHVSDLTKEQLPLRLASLPEPDPGPEEILIRVTCCGVCHTELDEIEGRLPVPSFPVVPGHQVIGIVEKKGVHVKTVKNGDRVGVAWIFYACGSCEYCLRNEENLCLNFKGTGKDANGGYAEYMKVNEKFAFKIPSQISDYDAAPLLCAGAIGYRSLRLSGIKNGHVLGLMGFGASGHLVLRMAKGMFAGLDIIVFARSPEEREFAKSLGAKWAGGIDEKPPGLCDAIIDTTPAWHPIVQSLASLKRSGRLVINAIRKEPSDINSLLDISYPDHLWMEKEIKSVANITTADVRDFLELAASLRVKPDVELYPFSEANRALTDLRSKHVKGAKVLTIP